jgi:hypothetical protein
VAPQESAAPLRPSSLGESAFDGLSPGFGVVGAGCVAEGGEAGDLIIRQFDVIGGDVLFEAADAPEGPTSRVWL